MPSAYAHICVACNHEAWKHGFIDGQNVDVTEGLYRCSECGCEITQASPTRKMSKTEYEVFLGDNEKEE